jgi:TM2 domain-containing membrane protein YozV
MEKTIWKDKKKLIKILFGMMTLSLSLLRNNIGTFQIELEAQECLITSGWDENSLEVLFTISLLFGIERIYAKNFIQMAHLTVMVPSISMIIALLFTQIIMEIQKMPYKKCFSIFLITNGPAISGKILTTFVI